MTITVLKTELLTALKPRMAVHGFKLQKGKERFARREPLGSWWFVLDFTVYEHLRVKPAMALRVDEVEDIFHRTSGFEARYQADTPTLSLSLQSLAGTASGHEYEIGNLESVVTVGAALEADFNRHVLPYFQRHSTRAAIEETLNRNPEGDCAHYSMDYLRCAHGVILARMVARPDYDRLVEIYRKKLTAFANGFYVPKFDDLVIDMGRLSARPGQ